MDKTFYAHLYYLCFKFYTDFFTVRKREAYSFCLSLYNMILTNLSIFMISSHSHQPIKIL